MKIRNTLLVLLIIIALVITGCSGGAATQTESETPSDVVVEEPEEATVEESAVEEVSESAEEIWLPDNYAGPAPTTDPVTLRIVRMKLRDSDEELIAKWNAEFMALYPNITIEEDVVPFGELLSKIQTEQASGTPPDIFYADGPNVKQYAFYEMIVPLNDYLTPEYLSDYVPATLAEHTYQGKIYAMPWAQATVLLYFNKDMAEAAGVTFPETTDINESLTWDEAMANWEKLQQDPTGSGTPEVWGLGASEMGSGGPGNYYADGMYIRSFGDPNADPTTSAFKTYLAISEDGTSVEGYINTPEAVQGMTFYQSIYQTKKVSPAASLPNMFQDLKAATAIYTDSTLGRLKNESPDLNWSATFIPRGNINFAHGGSLTWAISSSSEHPAEAAIYMSYLSDDTRQLEWWDVGRRLPARLSLYDKIDLYSEYPYSMVYAQLINATYSRPQTPAFGEYLAIIEPALKNIALGGDIEATLQEAEDAIQEALQNYQ